MEQYNGVSVSRPRLQSMHGTPGPAFITDLEDDERPVSKRPELGEDERPVSRRPELEEDEKEEGNPESERSLTGFPDSDSEESELFDEADRAEEISSSPDYDTDLETDLTHLEEPPIKDLKGRALYLRLCQELGLVPMSYLERNIEGRDILMTHRGLGVTGAKAAAPPLRQNMVLDRVNLADNMLGPEGGVVISTILQTVAITELNLACNEIGSEGAPVLAAAIKNSQTLVVVDLSSNEFEDKDGVYFADIIENNTSIRKLNLSRNRFCIEAGKALGTAIGNNDTIDELDLSWNHFRLQGAENLAKGLTFNLNLQILNLNMNGFGIDGVHSLSIALSYNKYLEELDLCFNRIPTLAALDFAKCLRINRTLKVLKMYGNPIQHSGAMEMLNSINQHTACGIVELDFRGFLVQTEFDLLAKEIRVTREDRDFICHIGYVSAGKDVEGDVDRFADKNPLEILLIFMGEQNLRLVDLFRSFDKDQSMSLTREEFINGLQEIKTPMSRDQLDELIDMLDKDGDGEIDLKEILNINKEFKDIKMKAARYVSEEKEQVRLEKQGKKETEMDKFVKSAMELTSQRAMTTLGTDRKEGDEEGGGEDGAKAAQRSVTAGGNEMKNLSGAILAAVKESIVREEGEDALPTEKPTVTAEEAVELNKTIKNFAMKGVLGKWKDKALV